MSAVKLGLGTLLKRGSTTIPEINTVGAGPERDVIDVTSHDSTAPAREFIAGLLNSGKVPFSGNFLPGSTNQKLLTTDLLSAAGTASTWHIVWSDGGVDWSFTAFVTKFAPGASVGDKLTFSGELQVTGIITIT